MGGFLAGALGWVESVGSERVLLRRLGVGLGRQAG